MFSGSRVRMSDSLRPPVLAAGPAKPLQPIYNYNELCDAMKARIEVKIADSLGTVHSGKIGGLRIASADGKSWWVMLLKAGNVLVDVLVKTN